MTETNEDIKALRLKAVGQQVADLRGKAGLTQRQLSVKAGVARCNIAKLERGYYNASIDVLGRLADTLGEDIIIKKS